MVTAESLSLDQQKIFNDPVASYWLKNAVMQTAERDPVDALRDAEQLVIFLRVRLALIQRGAQKRAAVKTNG